MTEYADLWLRQKHGTDVALLNAMAQVILSEGLENREFIEQRTEGFEEFRAAVEPYTPEIAEKITGVPADDITRAARAYAKADGASIVYSMGITQHTTGTDNVFALANLAMITGNIGKPGSGVNPLRGQNNVQGACDVGALPDLLPGYQRVDNAEARARFEAAWSVELSDRPGLTVVEMIDAADEGKLRAMYVMGENPVLSDPDSNHVESALKKLDFLVVQDIFLTETAQLADVVLPGTAWAEKNGTFTNTERRVQQVRKAVDPPGEAWLDSDILLEVANRMGYPGLIPLSSREDKDEITAIQKEMALLIPQYGGVFVSGESTGKQWPCPSPDHPGTPILHVGKFTRGLGKFHPVEFIPPKELPDEEYPFVLSTGRILEHYHTGTMSRRSEVLDCLVSVGVIEINPSDANRLGVQDGDFVKVSSRRGSIEIGAKVTERVASGTAFLAFHYREAPANRLTIAALDPVAKIPELKVCAVKIEKANRAT
ncbi:MAG: molybdopterin-dependent oxidoreductase [Armatimonadetes bacterium]|nr:molybdopterin-dependent oxidoreductase [Armatimonadota bacterium]